jgi:hypothetical protein
MDELLQELSFNPAERRQRLLAIATLLLLPLVIGAALVLRRFDNHACSDGSAQLDGAWDDARRASVRAAFLATGLPYAQSTFDGVARGLDHLAAAWKTMHRSACEATRVRGEQSPELLDLRMQCLDNQRRALAATTELFSRADAKVVQQALSATARLDRVEACSDGDACAGRSIPRSRPRPRSGSPSSMDSSPRRARCSKPVASTPPPTACSRSSAKRAPSEIDRWKPKRWSCSAMDNSWPARPRRSARSRMPSSPPSRAAPIAPPRAPGSSW